MTNTPSNVVEMLEYDSTTETYRIAYDALTTSPSLAVVSALDSLADEYEHETPLYDAIDPDALDRVLTPSVSAGTTDGRSVSFTHLGFRITVSSHGYLEIRSECEGDREVSER